MLSSAETLPHEENSLTKAQRYMDSASNSMTPRPQTVRSSSEYHSQTGSLYHHSSSFSSSPAELGSPQPLRRVEGKNKTVEVISAFPHHRFNHTDASCSAASSTTGPESLSDLDPLHLPNKNPSCWTIEEVMQFVKHADPTALAPHAELFRKHVRKNKQTTVCF